MLVLASQAHWLLRVALASVFLYHGLDKFPQLDMMAQAMGMPTFMIALVALAETLGGLGILVGGFAKDWVTRLSALALVPVMLGAIFMVHWGRWAFTATESHPMGGMEFQVVLLLIALFFLIRGNGTQANA